MSDVATFVPSKNFDMNLSHSNLAPKPLSDIAPSKAFTPFNGGGAITFMEHWKNYDLDNIDGEEWMDVDGYIGEYMVSSFGRVKSIARKSPNNACTKDKIMSMYKAANTGYVVATFHGDYKGNKKFSVHRLVATAFLEKNQEILLLIIRMGIN